MRTTHLIALSLLAGLPLLPGCIVAAAAVGGAAAGTVLLEDNTYVSHLNYPSNTVWAQTKATLAKKSIDPIDVDESRRRAVAKIEGTTVTCSVETYDLNVSVLKIEGRKFGFPENEIAKVVLDRITAELAKGR